MPIFRACFDLGKKLEQFSALCFSYFKILLHGRPFFSCFLSLACPFSTRKNATKTKKSRFFPLYLDSVSLKLPRCQFLGHVSRLGKKLEQFSALCFSYFKLLLHGRPFLSCFLSLACSFSTQKNATKTKKSRFFPLYLNSVSLKLLRCQFLGHVSHLGEKLEQFSALCFSYFKLLLHGFAFFSCFLSLACSFSTRKNAIKTKKSRFFLLYLNSVSLKLLPCQFLGHVLHLGKKLEQFSALCFSYFKILLHGRPSFSCFEVWPVHFQTQKNATKTKKSRFFLLYLDSVSLKLV